MKILTAKTYDFSNVKALTTKQLEAHYKLYTGYINKINEIDKISKNSEIYKDANAIYSPLRSLKLGESFSFDGAFLHELYFENIIKGSCCAHGKLIKLVDAQWDGFENFMNYLKDVCLSVRGWAIVTLDKFTDSLRIVGSDAHDVGAFWCATPILVIDVYEHAYFLDYGINKVAYVENILKSINWEIINDRIETFYSV